MKILQAIFTSLVNSSGGAEKVFCNMANEMLGKGHHVAGIYCDGEEGKPFYKINANVKLFNLYFIGEKIAVPGWRKLAREFLRPFKRMGILNPYAKYEFGLVQGRLENIIVQENPDVIICYDLDSFLLVNRIKQKQVKCVLMLHSDAETFWHSIEGHSNWAFSKEEIIKSIADVDCLQVLLPHDKEFLASRIGCKNIIVIPNVVQPAVNDKIIVKEKIIINIARLDRKQKRQHVLIKAFKQIAAKYPEWQVHLYGAEYTSGYKNELEKQIKRYHLEAQVKLLGTTAGIAQVLRHASIFAFPSAYEGFGMALTEAMAAGLPCVAFRSCIAAEQIIEDNYDGLLCADAAAALADELEQLIIDERLRNRLGENAQDSIKKYSAQMIWPQWFDLLKRL